VYVLQGHLSTVVFCSCETSTDKCVARSLCNSRAC